MTSIPSLHYNAIVLSSQHTCLSTQPNPQHPPFSLCHSPIHSSCLSHNHPLLFCPLSSLFIFLECIIFFSIDIFLSLFLFSSCDLQNTNHIYYSSLSFLCQ